jgi:hypothetical protein
MAAPGIWGTPADRSRPSSDVPNWPIAQVPLERQEIELRDAGLSVAPKPPRVVELAPGWGGDDRRIFDEVMGES